MPKCFNVNGLCYSDENYMVDLKGRLEEIKKLVDGNKYFVINRARQYGKTTTLWALKQYLKKEYIVLSMSFQRMSSAVFQDEYTFSREFANMLIRTVHNKRQGIDGFAKEEIQKLVQAVKDDKMNPESLTFRRKSTPLRVKVLRCQSQCGRRLESPKP